jgi:RNA recognition motif-containing protein
VHNNGGGDRSDNYRGQGQGGSSRGRVKRSRSRSLSIQKRDDVSGGRSKGKQIFVGNLPFSVTKTQLKEAFKDFGTI